MHFYTCVVNPKLPFTMDPEYQAANRAYMRYHNMDPIFGISSKYVIFFFLKEKNNNKF